jgi:hypothetical protein
MTWLHDAVAWLSGALVALAAAMGLGGDRGPLHVQGYVEGEYVYVAAPIAGRLQELVVAPPARRCFDWTAPASSRPATTRRRASRVLKPTSPI